MTEALIEVRGLSVRRAGRVVLDAVDLHLLPHERLFIRGVSGAGKTTLLHALLGFVPRAAGEIRILGRRCQTERDFAPLRGPIGLLFQDPVDQLFGPTVIDDVAFGPLNLGCAKDTAIAIAAQQLVQLGIDTLAQRPIHQLSGGQQRLVALAGVLAMSPKVLLLDEPTNGLDEEARHRLIEVLRDTALPMIVASHDTECQLALATRCQSL